MVGIFWHGLQRGSSDDVGRGEVVRGKVGHIVDSDEVGLKLMAKVSEF